MIKDFKILNMRSNIILRKINLKYEIKNEKIKKLEYKEEKKPNWLNLLDSLQPTIITFIIIVSICCLTMCSNNKTITTTKIQYSNDKNITTITHKNITKVNK